MYNFDEENNYNEVLNNELDTENEADAILYSDDDLLIIDYSFD